MKSFVLYIDIPVITIKPHATHIKSLVFYINSFVIVIVIKLQCEQCQVCAYVLCQEGRGPLLIRMVFWVNTTNTHAFLRRG